MRLRINHTTRYTYESPVSYALQRVRLRPQTMAQQTVHEWSVMVEGGQIEASYSDHLANHTDLVSVNPGAQTIEITASGMVMTMDTAGIIGRRHSPVPLWYYLNDTDLTRPGDGIARLSEALSAATDKLDGLHALSAEILRTVPYASGHTEVNTSAESALTGGHGVCQDHAQIFVSAARAAGVPARYVSGYLMMDDRIDQDASHAWAEAYLDTLGWVAFDVSNGISPDERYIRLASGLDSRDAAPISGLRMGSGTESLIVSVQVQQ